MGRLCRMSSTSMASRALRRLWPEPPTPRSRSEGEHHDVAHLPREQPYTHVRARG